MKNSVYNKKWDIEIEKKNNKIELTLYGSVVTGWDNYCVGQYGSMWAYQDEAIEQDHSLEISLDDFMDDLFIDDLIDIQEANNEFKDIFYLNLEDADNMKWNNYKGLTIELCNKMFDMLPDKTLCDRINDLLQKDYDKNGGYYD